MVACWGRRSGKTLCAAMEAVFELCLPNRRIWVVAPTYPLAEKVFREIYQLLVIEEILGPAKDVLKTANMSVRGGSMKIETKWGSWVEGKTAESPNSLVGEGLDFLIIDEAAKVNPKVWEQYLEPTLLDRQGRCLMITTPEGHNWLHDRFTFGDDPDRVEHGWQNSHMKSEDNPYLNKAWIKQKKEETTVEIFRQEYEASFEHHTGLIFPEWKDYPFPKGHLFDNDFFVPSTEHTHYRSIDPGSDNPTACIWACIDLDGNIYVYREYQSEGLLTEVHAGAINVSTLYPITQTLIDPAAAKRSATDGKSIQDAYSDHGIYTYPANNDVSYGLQAVARYFRATLEDNPKHPRIYIHKSCRKLRTQLDNYVWDDWASLTEKNKPDRPRKYKDHLVDCLRYLLASHPEHNSYYESPPIEPQPERHNIPGRPTTGVR